jgi:hypothetical protein
MKTKIGRFLKKMLAVKINALVLIFATSVMLYAAANVLNNNSKMYEFKAGAPISSSQINHNFKIVMPSKAVMAFNLTTCPEGWAPANGDEYYDGEGVQQIAPDLRGVFIRGLNKVNGVARSAAEGDPQTDRGLGTWQGDEFKKHTNSNHYLVYGGKHAASTAEDPRDNRNTGVITQFSETGGVETRPRNVALLYCIKK